MAHGVDFERARRLAAEANIAIATRRNADGTVRGFAVLRKTQPRLTFLGEVASEAQLLRLVRRCARCEAGRKEEARR